MASINVWLLEYYDPSLIHCLSLYATVREVEINPRFFVKGLC